MEKGGFTPLHIACGWSFEEVVHLLLENGAKNPVNADGKTPLDIMDTFGAQNTKYIPELLRKYGAKRARDLQKKLGTVPKR